MRFVAALVILTSLVGCAQYDEARNANLEAAGRDQVAADDAKCRSSGLQPGSPAYEDCRKRLAEAQARGTRGYQRMLDGMTNDRGGRPFGQ
ncbi:hypothetical protein [Undibacter mobilis]|uniref:Lipoprotein n=1 Tax=Undibacter mobilis TaxID=2292256 RepID=A0A371B709_9BRAD|nr:hypothetical protein [Undibacter mobilis]RDV03360.1 hypothetical protein DXH78_01405 [Undibacter mobilis]